MEYNTTRSRLLMPEYGRNVQKMIEYLPTIEDKERRLRNAEFIIELMGTLNPHLKTLEDYKHKLWDHLFQMTGFNLEVDSPYPPPTPEMVFKKPEPLSYPQSHIAHRHLGKNVESLFAKALAETDRDKKQGLTQTIGYYMKLAYGNWHKEPVHDDMVKTEIKVISEGLLNYETGGYKVNYEAPRPAFKQRSNNTNNPNSGNRKFNNPNNPNSAQAASGGGQRSNNFRERDNGASSGATPYGNNKFNKNKFNKNKNK